MLKEQAKESATVPTAAIELNSSPRRVVLAEDHAEHTKWMVDALSKLRPSWKVCATASNPEQLLEAIDEFVPEVLFLDVHLVGGTSLEVLSKLPYPIPIIFTTGDPNFAIDAYEHAAIDYILKPVRLSRLERSLKRLEEQESISAPRAMGDPQSGWLTAHKGQAVAIVHYRDILYLQSQTKYTRVILRDGEALLKRGLGLVEKQLDPARFFRIHRGTVVNIDHAGTLMRDDIGRLKLQMRGRSEWLFISKPFEKVFK